MKNYNLSNVRKGKKTTILAGVLIASAIVTVLLNHSSWLEVTPIIGLGIGLLPLKQ